MSRVSDAQRAFDAAAEEHEPSCIDDLRFTMDDLDAENLGYLRRICRLCPVFAECGDLAQALRPTAGVWAGNLHRTRKEISYASEE